MKSMHLRSTRGICPQCGEMVRAEVIHEGDRIVLHKHCPQHGASEALISKHPDFYRAIDKHLTPPFSSALRFASDAPHLNGVFVDVTGRCNLRCTCCLASVGHDERSEPKLADFLHFLKTLKQRPLIYLSGGEPTLRSDLPEWIQTLTEHGYTVKLLTNGLTLTDFAYVQQLKAAGLRWAMIQFDSLSDTALQTLRGCPLAEVRRQAVENCADAGLHIVLPCVIHPGANDHELGDLLAFAQRTPAVRQVSFLPAANQGNWSFNENRAGLEAADICDLLFRQTKGRIGRRDFLTQFSWMARLHRSSRLEHLAPRRCFLPLLATRNEQGVWPINRLPRSLGQLFSHVHAAKDVLGKLLQWQPFEQDEHPHDSLLYITIETFRERDSLDIDDACMCSRYYWADDRLTPACLYNLLYRTQEVQA